MEKTIKQAIREAGRVTTDIRKNFFSGYKFMAIRNWLEENGLNRHMAIELESTEIALITPFGVLMQIRRYDHDQLGMWGGVIEDGEQPYQAAARELFEETGIKIADSQLEFVEVNEHYHKYDNGDEAYFKSYRYIVRFENVPKVTTDEESVGAVMVAHTILSHQQDFIRRVLDKHCK